MRCNACGKAIQIEAGLLKEDVFEAKKQWGYFSKKDLAVDSFILCENCYDRITGGFVIPVERTEAKEVL